MRRFSQLLVLLLGPLLAAASLVGADLRIEQEIRIDGIPGAESASTQVLYFSGKKVRAEMYEQAILLDAASSRMRVVDDAHRTYLEIPMESLSALPFAGGGGLAGLLGQGSQPSLRETGRTRTIGEWEAREVEVTQTLGILGTIRIQAWVADNLGLDKEAMRSAATALGSLLPGAEASGKLGGWPIETSARIEVMGQVLTTTQRVRTIEEKPLDASLFEVPPGYEKRDLDLSALSAGLLGQ